MYVYDSLHLTVETQHCKALYSNKSRILKNTQLYSLITKYMLCASFGTMHALSYLILITVMWVTIIIFTFCS